MMRAIAFDRYGDAAVLQEVTLPVPEPGPGQVRVRVAAAAVNPADAALRAGRFKRLLRLALPFVPGSDIAGVVDAAAAGVTGWQPGDAVMAMTPTAMGGGYAEYALVPAEHLAPAPRSLTLGEAAALPLTGLTALQALRLASLGPGQELLLFGAAGGVGTKALQLGRVLGARVSAAASARRRPLLTELGADRVLDRNGDLRHDGDGYDVVFDATNHLPFRRSRRLLRPGGIAVTVNPVADKLAPDWLAWTRGGRRLRSVMVQPSGDDLRTLAGWVDEGRLRPVVEAALPLGKAVEAHRRSESGQTAGKLVLIVDAELAAQRPPAPAPAQS